MRTWLPWLAFALATLAVRWADGQARQVRQGDSGGYWSRVVKWTCYCLGFAMLGSMILESVLPRWWESGWHFHFDRVWNWWWAFPLALLVPFAIWGLLLYLMMAPAKDERDSAKPLRQLGASASVGRPSERPGRSKPT